jgi:hypothetical protein
LEETLEFINDQK